MADVPAVLAALAVMSAIAFALFGWDKRAAINGTWRIPESTLLLAAALGGSPGALLAQRVFRHKTQKQPFKTLLWLIILAQAAVVLWLGASFLPII